MVRVGIKVHILNFNDLVESMRAYPPMTEAEFYIASIDCGAFAVDTVEEVRALAAELSGASQKFKDADTEYESWKPKVLSLVA